MTVVSSTVTDDVAVVLIDRPPVNIGNAQLRAELVEELGRLGELPGLRAIVLGGAGSHFLAGSDISEFDKPLQYPQLPDVISIIEMLAVPVIAAISGLALGGGFELALGCDGRVADTTARLGFPEVTLGILPGAGGTVRSVRLAGVPLAIDLVASARSIDAREALEAGLVDLVVDGDLVAQATAFALALGGKRRARDLAVPESSQGAIESAIENASRRARPNALAAVDMVVRSGRMAAAAALEEERALFHRFRQTEEASNLRYLFFAKRAAAKAMRSAVKPSTVRHVGIAGAGTMGASLARLCVASGYEVAVFDVNEAAIDRLAQAVPGVRVTNDRAALANVDLLIDAVFEDMDVKKELLSGVEPVLSADAIIVSNTSYLDLDELATVLARGGRFAGLHFFNPADRNALVEIIAADTTDDRTLATLGVVAERLGKVAIPAGRGDGFVANRVYADYRAQAEFLVEDGATPQAVDAAMVALGFPIGPFAVADMSGLDIAWARRKRLAATRDPRQRYVTIPDTLCELGRLGKKTENGWYRYGADARRGLPDPAVDQIIDAARAARGIDPRQIGSVEITDRIVASMVCAAASLVDSGIAQRASDVDVAMTEGFAFPRWLGGPLRVASQLPEQKVIEMLALVVESCPVTFAIAKPAAEGRMPAKVAAVLALVRP